MTLTELIQEYLDEGYSREEAESYAANYYEDYIQSEIDRYNDFISYGGY